MTFEVGDIVKHKYAGIKGYSETFFITIIRKRKGTQNIYLDKYGWWEEWAFELVTSIFRGER